MIKRWPLICLGVLLQSSSAWAMTPRTYTLVMDAVSSRDLKSLQQMHASGIDLNSPLPNGMTPLCETVRLGDYEGYEMLLTQGASPYVACVRQLPQDQVASFYANQPAPHSYYTGSFESAKAVGSGVGLSLANFNFPILGVGEILLGGVAAAGILTLGRGGHAPGDDPKDNKYVWSAPLNLDAGSFETIEYKSSAFSGAVNVLGAINASSAYGRGYTGYRVKRQNDGTLNGDGEAAIDTTSRIKVAVLDEGVWTEHQELQGRIHSQYNFVYGVCSANNNGKCWEKSDEFDAESGMSKVYLYKNGERTSTSVEMTPVEWAVYATKYASYTYSENDATPHPFKYLFDNQKTYDLYVVGDTYYLYDSGNVNASDSLGGWPLTCEGNSCTTEDGTYSVSLTTDYENHGTQVAGLIGASKSEDGTKGMMGVAYDAELVAVKTDLKTTFEGLSQAVGVADIVNVSLNTQEANTYSNVDDAVKAFGALQTQSPAFWDGYKQAALNNKIIVMAAGNYTTDTQQPGEHYDSGLYSFAPLSGYFDGTQADKDENTYNLTNLLVNVVSVNSKKELAFYSAKCGVTKDYCIAAPGGDVFNEGENSKMELVYSAANSDEGYGYAGEMGTSFAAPVVSGALAVLKGAFPHLTNQQLVQILFETATDLGDPGVDEMYGHGLVNLDKATDPIGLQKIPLTTTVGGSAAMAVSSAAVVPAAFAGVAQVLPAQMVVLDKYDRAFPMATSGFVRVAKRDNKLDGRFKSFMRGNEKVVQVGDRFKMAYSERRSDLTSQMVHGAMSLDIQPTVSWHLKSFYTENTETTGGTYFERLMRAPYAKMKESWGGSVSYDFGQNWRTTLVGQVGQNGFVDERDLSRMEHNKISLFQSTLEYQGLKKATLKLTAGVTNEQGSVLGLWGKGAFKSGNSRTEFVGAGVALNLTDALTLEGMYYSGVTHVENGDSLLKMSDLKSDSFALTAAWHATDSRTFGLQLVSPLRVRRGRATVDLPVARDAYQDVVYRTSVSADLKPSAREYDFGLFYAEDLQQDVHLQSEFGVRLNPDHVSGADPDWRALVGVSFGL